MLPTDIQSPGQLLGAALAVEREAIKHYTDMAERMRHYGNLDTVDLFHKLAGEGCEREKQIRDWTKLEGIELAEFTEPVTWEDPLMPNTYDAEARDPYRSTPYKALAYAAHNAERIFHLYTHIAGTTSDSQTESYATILAQDALAQSRLLQSRRRRAFHSEHRGERQRQLDTALGVTSLTELHALAAGIEESLTDLLTTMAKQYSQLAPVAAQSQETTARCHAHLIGAGVPAIEPDDPCDTRQLGNDLHRDMLVIFTVSERAFNFYDTVLAHAYDEDIMLEAQRLAKAALARLEAIRAVQETNEIEPAP